jgi:hypothetical protein
MKELCQASYQSEFSCGKIVFYQFFLLLVVALEFTRTILFNLEDFRSRVQNFVIASFEKTADDAFEKNSR